MHPAGPSRSVTGTHVHRDLWIMIAHIVAAEERPGQDRGAEQKWGVQAGGQPTGADIAEIRMCDP